MIEGTFNFLRMARVRLWIFSLFLLMLMVLSAFSMLEVLLSPERFLSSLREHYEDTVGLKASKGAVQYQKRLVHATSVDMVEEVWLNYADGALLTRISTPEGALRDISLALKDEVYVLSTSYPGTLREQSLQRACEDSMFLQEMQRYIHSPDARILISLLSTSPYGGYERTEERGETVYEVFSLTLPAEACEVQPKYYFFFNAESYVLEREEYVGLGGMGETRYGVREYLPSVWGQAYSPELFLPETHGLRRR